MYDISAKKGDREVSMPKVNSSHNAGLLIRGLVHEGYAVTIKEIDEGCPVSDCAGVATPPQANVPIR